MKKILLLFAAFCVASCESRDEISATENLPVVQESYSNGHNHLSMAERIEQVKRGFFVYGDNITEVNPFHLSYDDPDGMDFSNDECVVSDVTVPIDYESYERILEIGDHPYYGLCFYCLDCEVFHFFPECDD